MKLLSGVLILGIVTLLALPAFAQSYPCLDNPARQADKGGARRLMSRARSPGGNWARSTILRRCELWLASGEAKIVMPSSI